MAVLALFLWCSHAQCTEGPVYYELSQTINQVAYSAGTERLYATVPASAGGPYANRVIEVNPATGQITRSVFLGNEPNALAISPDGSFAYVGLDGPAAVRRLQLATLSGGLQFGLGQMPFGAALFAEAMVILPNQPDSVAISRRNFCCSPHSYGTAIYDNGVARPNTTEGGGSGWSGCPTIALRDPSTLLGLSNESTNYQLQVQHIDATGVGVVDVVSNVVPGFYEKLVIHGGVAFATSGRAVDPQTLGLLGTFASSGLIVPDAVAGIVAIVDRDNPSIQLFDRATYVPLLAFELPTGLGNPSAASACGLECLAFGTDGGKFVIAQMGRDPVFADDFDD